MYLNYKTEKSLCKWKFPFSLFACVILLVWHNRTAVLVLTNYFTTALLPQTVWKLPTTVAHKDFHNYHGSYWWGGYNSLFFNKSRCRHERFWFWNYYSNLIAPCWEKQDKTQKWNPDGFWRARRRENKSDQDHFLFQLGLELYINRNVATSLCRFFHGEDGDSAESKEHFYQCGNI